ncbi:MAG: Hsp70 family protein [Polyangia bacterium]
MTAARYLVGIDLGTTNSALAFIDTHEKPRRVRDFPMPQLVGPGDVAARPTLPSLHHHVGEHELPPGATRLPWTPKDAAAPDHVVGELARAQTALVPGRSVLSAKSWLCHPRVDRLADILPWGGAPDVPRLSPVEVSARYLRHMLAAFCFDKQVTLEAVEVVLTVPASFDEVARELTVEAARRAGLPLERLTLLEEPQAAFYHWLADHARLAEEVEAGDLIFVCDIGGGTTDFTLIEVHKSDSAGPNKSSDKSSGKGRGDVAARKIRFARTAVGDHLLLGGDNMDLALAKRLEQTTLGGGRLPPHTFSGLVQACRTAKERLLGEAAPERFGVHVAGRGSKLIGGGLHAELLRADVEATLLDGFFPRVGADAEPARQRAGLQEFGLPYAADPAVTRYIAAFLRQHRARPTVVLFNGGVLCAAAIRQRILDVIARINMESAESTRAEADAATARPRLLTNDAPDLAVARGAAYYALSRKGEGLRITGGAARAYYVEVEGPQRGPEGRLDVARGEQTLVCLTPRGLDEGSEVELRGRPLQLLTNRPVRFRLFSSAQREGDQPGDVLRLPPSELTELPPLYTVLRHPRSSQERPIEVSLGARITEIGTLELWARSLPGEGDGQATKSGKDADEPIKWRLQFDLRSSEGLSEGAAPGAEPAGDGAETEGVAAPGVGSAEAGLLAAAAEHLNQVFTGSAPVAGLPKALQSVLGPRDGWSTATLRGLWEALKAHRERRGRSAAHEARWLNLAGFCLRPGFGYALDDWRVKEAWRVFNAGLIHEREDPCKLEWWILWRRIAGGLSRTQQDELWKRVAPLVLPSLRRLDKKPPSPQELAEIWRAVASCERIEVKKKIDLGEALLSQLEKKRSEYGLWALGRLGARMPLYASIDNVVPPAVAQRWLGRLMALRLPEGASAEERYQLGQAAAELGRLTGDRVRDLPEGERQKLAAWLLQIVAGPDGKDPASGGEGRHLARIVTEVVPREEREERFAFGDTLPAGLRLIAIEPAPAAEPGG